MNIQESGEMALQKQPQRISSSDLFNKIIAAGGLHWIVDVRPEADFNRFRLHCSTFIPWADFYEDFTTISKKRPLLKEDIYELSHRISSAINNPHSKDKWKQKQYYKIYIYSKNSPCPLADSFANFLLNYLNEGIDKEQVFVLIGGIETFTVSKPCLVLGHPSHVPVTSSRTLPSEILEDFLYLGGVSSANNLPGLQQLRINYVLNTAIDADNRFPDKLIYMKFDLDDTPEENIERYFDKGRQFIEEAKKNKGRIIVHCQIGMSRSTTIVLVYLMYTFKWSLKRAYKFVKSKRCFVNPNYGFMWQLAQFEKKIFNGNSSIEFTGNTKTFNYVWIDDPKRFF